MFDAARALFEQGGYAAASIEAIGERSGVAKTTIYRRWPNRAALLVDLLAHEAEERVPLPEGPDPMRALRNELRGAADAVSGYPGHLLVALLGQAQNDPQIRTALVEKFFQPRSRASAKSISRAQAAGSLRPDAPASVAVDLVFGPMFFRLFVQHAPITDRFVQQVLQYALEGLQARPARSSSEPPSEAVEPRGGRAAR